MKSLRINAKLKILLVSLLVAVCVILSAIAGVVMYTNARSVTISTSSNIFVTSSGTARVRARQVQEGEDTNYYTMFGVADGGTVSYRKHLAYRWMENVGSDDQLVKEEGYLNMEVGLGDLNFENVRMTFESQQYAKDNSDTKTTNYIVFVPVAESDDTVNVIITDDEDNLEVGDAPVALNKDKISISLSNYNEGEYTVTITDGTSTVTGAFTNVGGTFARYSSSSTSPLYPLIFSAEFEENSNAYADIALYSLNGQSFNLTGVSTQHGDNDSIEYYYGGTVTDELAPVLCLNESLEYLTTNSQISLNYTIIDVLSTNTTSTINYFTLKNDQVTTDGIVDGLDIYSDTLYKEVSSSDNQYLVHHEGDYYPDTNDYDAAVFDGENFTVDGAVKVAIEVRDSSSSVSTYVLLDWYIADKYLITPNSSAVPFVAVARDELGASYTYTDDSAKTSVPSNTNTAWTEAVSAYQTAVTAAARDLKAGSSNYFYLPSAETLLQDNSTDFSDLNLYMYYISSSGRNSVSGKSGTISLSLSTSGKYIFTIFATDKESNNMYYYDAENKLQEISSSDIWNFYDQEEGTEYEDMRQYLPWFEFEVTSSDLTIDDAEEQDTAYVGESYTFSSSDFETNGTSYTTSYRLFLFDSSRYYEVNNTNLVYSEFMAQKTQLFEEHREYFIEIMPSTQSTSEGYYLYEDYAWNGSSSFVPQDDNSFYLVVAALTSTESISRPTQYAYMGILSSALAESLVGEDTWVQDNLASIILLSIAGAALVGIVIILLIKPKDKGDLDAQLETGKKDSDKKEIKSKKKKK